jgi:predicted NBD/HSP70 family sugar kinase
MMNGLVCKCGNRGCLQSYASDEALLSRLKLQGAESISEALNELQAGRHPEYRDAFSETAKYIGIAVEHMLKIFDPDAVFVQSSWLPSMPDVFAKINEAVYDHCSWIRRDKFSIILTNDKSIITSSAACIIIEKLYNPTTNNLIYKKFKS